MKLQKIFNDKIEEIKNDQGVNRILLVGAAAKKDHFEIDKHHDIDLFVVRDSGNDFMREVKRVEGVSFDISYISAELLERVLEDKVAFIISTLNNFRTVYQKDEGLNPLFNKVKLILKEKPKPIMQKEKNYIRFKLTQDYEDIRSRLKDWNNAHFLLNNLFKTALVSYYKLNRLWLVKEKKLLKEIEKTNKPLHILCNHFIQENNTLHKFELLAKILKNILTPFGGLLMSWEKGEFPLK